MRFTIFVPREIVKALSYERPSTDLRVFLTRTLRRKLSVEGEDAGVVELIRLNQWINRSRTLAGKSVYVLESDDWGHYMPAEYAWHFAEFEVVFRRLDTIQFAEYLGELLEERFFGLDWLNKRIEADGLGFQFAKDADRISVVMRAAEEIEALANSQPTLHDNLRLLIGRMDKAAKDNDCGALIHASASIFETLAKQVVGLSTVQNQTLASFFDRYRKDSGLPQAVLDYVRSIYDSRNSMPLAGHGSLSPPPSLAEKEVITLVEMTKAFVAIEYKVMLAGTSTGGAAAGALPVSPAVAQPASLPSAPSGANSK